MKIKRFDDLNESVKNQKVFIEDNEFEISDEKIEMYDYFIEIEKDGKVEPYIHQLVSDEDADDYFLHGTDIEVIVLNKEEFEWNLKTSNYKKIVNIDKYLNESKKSIPKNIIDLKKRASNGEKLSKDDVWDLHVWLCDNDSIYKKAWEDSVYRHQMSLDPKDRLKEYRDKK